MPRRASGPRPSLAPLGLAGLAALSAALLAWGASRHGLHFVDLVGFSRRARELAEGRPASDGLYPLGFPALLALGHGLGAPVLATARALSVAAGVGLLVAAGRRLGLAAGAWVLVQLPLLTWATTEGTDLPAAGLALAGVLLAARRPGLAGLLVGAALTVRWTAAAWVPAALLAAPAGGRARLLGAALLGLTPHAAACAWTGALVLPDQGLNLRIAAGPGAPPGEAGLGAALLRVPEGLGRALPHALPDLYARVGAFALALPALPPAPRARAARGGPSAEPAADDVRLARALALGASLHVLALAAVFANGRLALPATLAAALGLPLALRRAAAWAPRLGGLGAAALGLGALAFGTRTVPRLAETPPEAEQVAELEQALRGVEVAGPVMANSPLVHTRVEGWLVPGIQLGGLYVTPRTTPAQLAAIADQHGLRVLVLDPTRGARDTEGLAPLRDAKLPEVDGWTRRSAGRWRVWERTD